MKCVITVDTEADNQWKHDTALTLKNIKALPRFQKLCTQYGFPPTYLVTYEVAVDAYAASLLKKWQNAGEAEIGAHLHPWSTPPYDDGDVVQRFPSELSETVFREKMETLTQVIRNTFKKSPTSYRAGRWGFREEHAHVLTELGYVVDCSITPKIDWGERIRNTTQHTHIPNFTSASVMPQMLGDTGLLEVPMTILYTGAGIQEDSFLARLFAHARPSVFKQVLHKLVFKERWCRIYASTTVGDLERVYWAAQRNQLPVIEFMIHSSELAYGCSPATKTHEAVEHTFQVLEDFLAFLKRQGVEGNMLQEYAILHE